MHMTHAQLAARLLKDAAAFFRQLADENPTLTEAMMENAEIYDEAAGLIEQDPNGVVEIEEITS